MWLFNIFWYTNTRQDYYFINFISNIVTNEHFLDVRDWFCWVTRYEFVCVEIFDTVKCPKIVLKFTKIGPEISIFAAGSPANVAEQKTHLSDECVAFRSRILARVVVISDMFPILNSEISLYYVMGFPIATYEELRQLH